MQKGFEDFKLEIELIHKNAKLPTRANSSDAGLDVYSPVDVIIYPKKDTLIPLGWRCSLPEGYYLLMLNKSGRAVNNKLMVGAQVIDSGYRGIVHCHLFNHGTKEVIIKSGEKISQMVVQQVWSGKPIQVENININTERGEGGFGSSGI